MEREDSKIITGAEIMIVRIYGFWLCIKPVTEPDQTEPTEITELT